MKDRELLDIAREAAKNAYVPYSHFPVGAALECMDGTVFTGCNVENAALGSTICAERTAFVIAISGEGANYCLPCGACRQFMHEFAPSMEVLCTRGDGRYVSYRLDQLMPYPFEL